MLGGVSGEFGHAGGCCGSVRCCGSGRAWSWRGDVYAIGGLRGRRETDEHCRCEHCSRSPAGTDTHFTVSPFASCHRAK